LTVHSLARRMWKVVDRILQGSKRIGGMGYAVSAWISRHYGVLLTISPEDMNLLKWTQYQMPDTWLSLLMICNPALVCRISKLPLQRPKQSFSCQEGLRPLVPVRATILVLSFQELSCCDHAVPEFWLGSPTVFGCLTRIPTSTG